MRWGIFGLFVSVATMSAPMLFPHLPDGWAFWIFWSSVAGAVLSFAIIAIPTAWRLVMGDKILRGIHIENVVTTGSKSGFIQNNAHVEGLTLRNISTDAPVFLENNGTLKDATFEDVRHNPLQATQAKNDEPAQKPTRRFFSGWSPPMANEPKD